MTKTDQLVDALRTRHNDNFKDHHEVDSIVLGYFTGLLGVLEKSDDKLAAALDYHLQDTLRFNKKLDLK
jgi:hypothetical protein